jgi:NTP pyrophosphatase (non-canonical NTP hydrolase)
MGDIGKMMNIARKFRDDRDWKRFHTSKDIAMDISIEANELLEHFLWNQGDDLKKYTDSHHEEIADELSDVIHGVLLLADELNIDVMDAFTKKMIKNEKKYPVELARSKNLKHDKLNK